MPFIKRVKIKERPSHLRPPLGWQCKQSGKGCQFIMKDVKTALTKCPLIGQKKTAIIETGA